MAGWVPAARKWEWRNEWGAGEQLGTGDLRRRVFLGGRKPAFRALPGVVDSRVGYAVEAADEALQIEVVQVDFDPQVLAYSTLIEHFWGLHDPTSVDRQASMAG